MDPHRHVALVGMMGVGKTSVGRRIARRTDRQFVDLDELVVEREGHSIQALFDEVGEDGFRERETAALADTLQGTMPTVIATGGGVVVRAANRDLLASLAFVVWLTADPQRLLARVGTGAGRPMLGASPDADLARLFDERRGWYASVADAEVSVGERDLDEVEAAVLAVLR